MALSPSVETYPPPNFRRNQPPMPASDLEAGLVSSAASYLGLHPSLSVQARMCSKLRIRDASVPLKVPPAICIMVDSDGWNSSMTFLLAALPQNLVSPYLARIVLTEYFGPEHCGNPSAGTRLLRKTPKKRVSWPDSSGGRRPRCAAPWTSVLTSRSLTDTSTCLPEGLSFQGKRSGEHQYRGRPAFDLSFARKLPH